MSCKITQFGCGYMGEIWANVLRMYADHLVIVERESKCEAAEQLNANHIKQDLMEDTWESAKSSNILSSDVWSIAVRPDVNQRVIRKGFENDIPTIIVEQPALPISSSEKQKLLENKPEKTTVAVDYVELSHTAYQRAISDMKKYKFQPDSGFHWRGKDLEGHRRHPNGRPFISDNMVQDFAEIDYMHRFLYGNSPNYKVKNVNKLEFWKEHRTDDKIDLSAHVEIETDTGEFEIRGGYNESKERRYFFWYDSEKDIGYFVNTLNRYHITPQAYRVHGKENIEKIMGHAEMGEFTTDARIKNIMSEVNAFPIGEDMYDKRFTPIHILASRVISKKSRPKTDLKDAIRIENFGKQLYREVGELDAAKFP